MVALVAFIAFLMTVCCSNRLANDNEKTRKNYAVVKNLVSFEYKHYHGSMYFNTPEYTGSMTFGCKVERDKEGRYQLSTSRWEWGDEMKLVHDSIFLPDSVVQQVVDIVNLHKLYKMPPSIEIDTKYMALDAGSWSASLEVDSFATDLHFGDYDFPKKKSDAIYPTGVKKIASLLKDFVKIEE